MHASRRNPPVRSGIFFCVLTRLTVVYADDNSSRLDEIATEHSSCAEDTPAWTAWRAGQIDPIAVGHQNRPAAVSSRLAIEHRHLSNLPLGRRLCRRARIGSRPPGLHQSGVVEDRLIGVGRGE